MLGKEREEEIVDGVVRVAHLVDAVLEVADGLVLALLRRWVVVLIIPTHTHTHTHTHSQSVGDGSLSQ